MSHLVDFSNHVTLYASVVIIFIGVLAAICNLLTFTSKEFHSNSSALYFVFSTFFDLTYLLLSGSTRSPMDYFIWKNLVHSNVYCKCRIYLVLVLPSLSGYFLTLVTIDRCLCTSSSRKWRLFSRRDFARRVSLITVVFAFVSHSHILFFYQSVPSHFIHKCIPSGKFYRLFLSVYHFTIHPLSLYAVMLTCCLLTLMRVKTLRCRSADLTCRKKRRRTIDRHLIGMMFVQVGLGILLTSFRCTFLLYTFWSGHTKKSVSTRTWELFFDKFSLLVYYMNFGKAFPLNVLTSALFQEVFEQRIARLFATMNRFGEAGRSSSVEATRTGARRSASSFAPRTHIS